MTALEVSRPAAFWVLQHGMTMLGIAFLVAGIGGPPGLALLGAAALTFAGLRAFAATQGYAVPRPGHVRIVPYGCWDLPFRFAVRRRGCAFLFHRALDPETEGLPEAYSVYALPEDGAEEQLRFFAFEPPQGSRALGSLPVTALRFDHRGGAQVGVAELDAGLSALTRGEATSQRRPRGLALIGILNFVGVASYLGFLTLALLSPTRLGAVLVGLAAEGAGRHPLERLGPMLPAYFAVMAVLMGLLSVSFWRMKNWTRLVVLAIAWLSLVGSFQALVAAAGAGSLSGSALSLFRVGLCVTLIHYLMQPCIRALFRSPARH
jgi:hypothetical protein